MYHAMSWIAWNSSVIFGIAVLMIVLSSAMQNTARHIAVMIAASLHPEGYRSASARGTSDLSSVSVEMRCTSKAFSCIGSAVSVQSELGLRNLIP